MKRAIIFSLPMLSILAIFSSCRDSSTNAAVIMADTTAKFDLAVMKKIIDKKDADWAKAITTPDSAGMLYHFCKDGKIFPPNAAPVEGQVAIAAFISNVMKYGIKQYKDETTALYGNGDNLVEEGKYVMGDNKGNLLDSGKYVAIWRQEDGDWKIYSDIYNSNIPSAAEKK
jgi:ketosteroid isomerase-like protein